MLFLQAHGRHAEDPDDKEEEDGADQGEEGCPDSQRHLTSLHPHMDALQHHGADLHLLFRLHPHLPVAPGLLAVLRQQHHQPHVLRALQQDLPEDFPHAATMPVEEEERGGQALLVWTKPSHQQQQNNMMGFYWCGQNPVISNSKIT